MLARVLAMALRLCLPQVGSLSHEIDGLRLVLVWRLLSTSPVQCYKEIQVGYLLK